MGIPRYDVVEATSSGTAFSWTTTSTGSQPTVEVDHKNAAASHSPSNNSAREEFLDEPEIVDTSTLPQPSPQSSSSSNQWNSPPPVTTEDDNEQPRISWFDAAMHLIKGNLGPGCLNLPHAFVLSGWLLGTCLMLVVAIQGIYSMVLLAECKDLLQSYQVIQQDEAAVETENEEQGDVTEEIESEGSASVATASRHPTSHQVSTFMDVAHVSLGGKGQALVQVFLFVMQTGVCCVFLSLLTTNLQAQTGMDVNSSIGVVTLALLGIVWVRFLKGLKWLSTTANVFMIIAIGTASVAGLHQLWKDSHTVWDDDSISNSTHHDAPREPMGTKNVGDIATFISSMFFSFEGIGLVLPVENSFVGTHTSSTPREEQHLANILYRSRVLPLAMSFVAFLFLLVGLTASLGFPDIETGSITAYLEERFDHPWFAVVNTLVMVAVFLTFPLQLTPALEVLEEWGVAQWNWGSSRQTSASQEDQATSSEHAATRTEGPDERNWWRDHSWILPRYAIVFFCALVVVLVDDLSLLMALFGALGQTGLAVMPCLCHLALQAKGLAAKHQGKTIMNLFTIALGFVVMVSGLAVSMDRIYKEEGGGR